MSKHAGTQSSSFASKESLIVDGPAANATPQKSKSSGRATSKLPSKSRSKIALVLAQLRRSKGTILNQLMASTGWQARSLRAVIRGLRKQVISNVRLKAKNGATIYRAEKS